MRVRYRKLEAEFDGEGYKQRVGAAYEAAAAVKLPDTFLERTLGSNPPSPLGAAISEGIVAMVDNPEKVTASEHEATLDEVRALLKEGKLNGQDLIDVGSGWQSIADCIPLQDDVPSPPFDVAKAVVVVCVLAFLFALLLIFRS